MDWMLGDELIDQVDDLSLSLLLLFLWQNRINPIIREFDLPEDLLQENENEMILFEVDSKTRIKD
jgi:hypothetical protein